MWIFSVFLVKKWNVFEVRPKKDNSQSAHYLTGWKQWHRAKISQARVVFSRVQEWRCDLGEVDILEIFTRHGTAAPPLSTCSIVRIKKGGSSCKYHLTASRTRQIHKHIFLFGFALIEGAQASWCTRLLPAILIISSWCERQMFGLGEIPISSFI